MSIRCAQFKGEGTLKISIPGLKYILRKSTSQATSSTPAQWSEENPTVGHCAVFALMVQDKFGGSIVRKIIEEPWQKILGTRSHYWNIFKDNTVVDLSREQFPETFKYSEFISLLSDGKDQRDYILSFKDTENRYTILKQNFERVLEENIIFQDEKFQKSWEVAFSENAKCPKMRFGCLVYEGERLITSSPNRLMTTQFDKPRFCSLDGTQCVRMGIASRVDAVVGDCAHAPVWCLKQVLDLGYTLRDLPKLDFYEGGFFIDGTPWERKDASYTCTYCENIFATFGLDKIWGIYNNQWTQFLTSESFYNSGQYALGEKKT